MFKSSIQYQGAKRIVVNFLYHATNLFKDKIIHVQTQMHNYTEPKAQLSFTIIVVVPT